MNYNLRKPRKLQIESVWYYPGDLFVDKVMGIAASYEKEWSWKARLEFCVQSPDLVVGTPNLTMTQSD